MKRNYVCVLTAILYFFSFSIPALAQVSVTGGSHEVPTNLEKHNANLKVVDEKLKLAGDLMRAQPPNYDQAIAVLTEARQMAPDQDGVWYRLGVAYLGSANAQANAPEKTKRYTEAYNDLEKAIAVHNQRKTQELLEDLENLTPVCNVEGVCKHVVRVSVGEVSKNHKLAVYYSNLGDAAAKLGKNGEAIKDFEQASQLDPPDAGTYYFNEGILLRNAAKSMDERKQAVKAFDKAIAADPNKAVAYYLKGEVLFGMLSTDSGGKPVPPPGTLDALQKYLELQPNGPYAAQARSFLVVLNSAVPTSDGKGSSNKE